ncbi:hypothetical protein V493_04519 [Pseudogymnoascus sp. VKM F-4281 (FW-2241)]|nr:hypothetical protein V493_04519 [Pseudogymnoascus sp. VKM F-4281 (FW-2241)]
MFLRQAALLATAILPLSFAQVSEDFEGGWDEAAWPIYAPDCNQGGTVALDSTTAHSGTNSMKVTSPGGFCGHIFFGTTNVPTGDVYVKVWLKATTALTASHVSFITMPDSSQGEGKHLRIGGQNEILMYNRETDDATLPDLSPQGTATSKALAADTWECFEYHLGTDGSIETWLNSEAIAGLTTADNPNAGGWGTDNIPTITGVYFGWESYGGDVNTFWYDDIAVGSTRVGCDGGDSSPSSVPTSSAPAGTAPATSEPVSSGQSSSAADSSVPATSAPASSEPASSAPATSGPASSAPVTSGTNSTVPATSGTNSSAPVTSGANSTVPATSGPATSAPDTTMVTSVKPTSASSAPSPSTTAPGGGGTVPLYGQCGGKDWTGGTVCETGTCTANGEYYSQCLP